METERLIIDAIKASDKDDFFTNISHDRRVLETFICAYAETPEQFDFSKYPGREDLFAIRLKETGCLIGIILYFDEKDGACEIGYGLGSAYWGRGYATEAVRRFLEYCFRERGLETVYASFFTGNEASRRVMEKCGMTFSRFSEKELTYLGKERDLTYYSVSRPREENDWENLSYEEKNHQLFRHQKALLGEFLRRGAISRAQYEKSLGDLKEKTGYND